MIYEEDINYDILLLLQLLFEQISSLKPTSGPYEHVYMYIHIHIYTHVGYEITEQYIIGGASFLLINPVRLRRTRSIKSIVRTNSGSIAYSFPFPVVRGSNIARAPLAISPGRVSKFSLLLLLLLHISND